MSEMSEVGGEFKFSKVCVVGELQNDKELLSALSRFNLPICFSADGGEYVSDARTVYVLDSFDGDVFRALYERECRILGRTVVLEMADKGKKLPVVRRPLYCTSMVDCILNFTGYKKKEDLTTYMTLIHHMGGSIRKDFSPKVTHLIAGRCDGDKYRYALTFGKPIVSEKWLFEAWDRRSVVGFKASNKELMEACKLKPFHTIVGRFHGFSDDEEAHMKEIFVENGGKCFEDGDTLTHIVVDENLVTEFPDLYKNVDAFIVKSEWFWASVQMDACADENLYLFVDHPSCLSPKINIFSSSTPKTRSRKRKRLRDTVAQLAQNDLDDSFNFLKKENMSEKRSSATEIAMLSISASFLDTPEPTPSRVCPSGSETPVTLNKIELNKMSPRQQVFMELFQTETNYVQVLKVIMEVFKEPLENENLIGGAILNQQELKHIFGNLPPIYDAHSRMLENFLEGATNYYNHWPIGQVFLDFAEDFLKAYPPFINYFEKTKEMIQQCDRNKPRFHAFLKVCLTKPECGRQSLSELMMRPVQRLPSVTLLLNDLIKHTDKENPDHELLQAALAKIKEVLTHINEDKRKTASQVHIFDIFNDIENCPPHLVSSHRSFVARLDVVEITNGSHELSGKGNELAFFLFDDVLEICKRRSRHLTLRSPSTANLANVSNYSAGSASAKLHKHVELFPLSAVKRVVNIRDCGECRNVFALICRINQDFKDQVYSFQVLPDDAGEKSNFVKMLCKNIANAMCKTNPEYYLVEMKAHELNIDASEVRNSTLSRAYRSLHKTTQKVGRAFSFNKTPSKLRRAVSSMMSPAVPRHPGTPSEPLHNLRLNASSTCTNLHEGDSPKSKNHVVDPVDYSQENIPSQPSSNFTVPQLPTNVSSTKSYYRHKSMSLGCSAVKKL